MLIIEFTNTYGDVVQVVYDLVRKVYMCFVWKKYRYIGLEQLFIFFVPQKN